MELDEEQKELLEAGKEYKEMCQTKGWNRLEAYISQVIKEINEYIAESLPKDYQGFVEEIVSRRAKKQVWTEVLDHVKSHVYGAADLEKQMKGESDD